MNTRTTSRWAMATALCGVVLLAACEGENLFDMQANPNLTPRLEVFAPDFVYAGDTVSVSLTATAALNVQRIAVEIRGAVTKDTVITTAAAPSVNAIVKVPTPVVLPANMLLINAQVTDVSGRLSRAVADTVLLLIN